jgi:CRISPR-associated protein Cpf1
MIDFFKSSLNQHPERKNFHFHFKPTAEYEDISAFYTDVERQGYNLSWQGINYQYLQNLVEQGKCYLFEISCKDFQKQNPTSKDSLQAIYRKTLFQPHSNIKLNGEAEIFFRPASLEQKEHIVAKTGHSIGEKNGKSNPKALKN